MTCPNCDSNDIHWFDRINVECNDCKYQWMECIICGSADCTYQK